MLGGGAFGWDLRGWITGQPPINQSHTFIAIDIAAFEPVGEFKRRMDRPIQEIRIAPKARGADRIYLPGEREWEHRAEALVQGLNLPEDVRASLRGLAEDLGMTTKWSDGLKQR